MYVGPIGYGPIPRPQPQPDNKLFVSIDDKIVQAKEGGKGKTIALTIFDFIMLVEKRNAPPKPTQRITFG